MSQDPVDIEELVKEWANSIPMDTRQQQNKDELRSTDIDWKYFRVRHGPTEYQDQMTQSAPQTHTISTAHFTNSTGQTQTYCLKSERRTRSTCCIAMEKTFTIGYTLDIKLAPPNPVVEANAGFQGEQTVTNANEQTFEEELVWSVDSEIVVPPKSCITADLVLKEREYTSNFRCRTKFEGVIVVNFRNKRTNMPFMCFTVDPQRLCRAENGFQVDNTGVYFESRGQCKCRFGIEQHVKLTQTALPTENQTLAYE